MRCSYTEKDPLHNRPWPIQWDQFDAFHRTLCVANSTCTVFDTGEVLWKGVRPDPEDRTAYPPLGLSLWGTTDTGLGWAFALPDGTPVKQAWLSPTGIQTLLIDHTAQRAVNTRLAGIRMSAPELQIPSRFRDMSWSVYWPGAERLPVGAIGIAVALPVPMPDELQQHVTTLGQACRAWVAMDPSVTKRDGTYHVAAPHGGTLAVPRSTARPIDRAIVQGWTFGAMNAFQRVTFLLRGVMPEYRTVTVPYLCATPTKDTTPAVVEAPQLWEGV